jgi:hypothetical protein
MPNVTLYVPAGVSTVAVPGSPLAIAANGTVSVPPGKIVSQLLDAGCQYVSSDTDVAWFVAPILSELVSIVAAAAPTSGTAMTIALQPAYAVKLNVRGVYSGAVAGLVVNIVGTDGRGNAVSETVNVAAAASTTFKTVNAYSHVTSITPVGTVTNVTTIGVGQSNDFALPLPPTFTDLVVYKEGLIATGGLTAAPVDETVGTVDTFAGTWAPSSACNGTKCYAVSYSWNTLA